jgi:hypothetical protein
MLRLVCLRGLFGTYLFDSPLFIGPSGSDLPCTPIFSYLFRISKLFLNQLFAFSLIIIALSKFFHA